MSRASVTQAGGRTAGMVAVSEGRPTDGPCAACGHSLASGLTRGGLVAKLWDSELEVRLCPPCAAELGRQLDHMTRVVSR